MTTVSLLAGETPALPGRYCVLGNLAGSDTHHETHPNAQCLPRERRRLAGRTVHNLHNQREHALRVSWRDSSIELWAILGLSLTALPSGPHSTVTLRHSVIRWMNPLHVSFKPQPFRLLMRPGEPRSGRLRISVVLGCVSRLRSGTYQRNPSRKYPTVSFWPSICLARPTRGSRRRAQTSQSRASSAPAERYQSPLPWTWSVLT